MQDAQLQDAIWRHLAAKEEKQTSTELTKLNEEKAKADVAQAKATAIASLVSNLGDDLDEETKTKKKICEAMFSDARAAP